MHSVARNNLLHIEAYITFCRAVMVFKSSIAHDAELCMYVCQVHTSICHMQCMTVPYNMLNLYCNIITAVHTYCY